MYNWQEEEEEDWRKGGEGIETDVPRTRDRAVDRVLSLLSIDLDKGGSERVYTALSSPSAPREQIPLPMRAPWGCRPQRQRDETPGELDVVRKPIIMIIIRVAKS